MIGYVLDDQRIGVRFVVGGGIFLLTTASTSTPNPMYPLPNATAVISQGAKRSDCYAKLSPSSKPLSNSDLKNLDLQLGDAAKVYGGP